MKMLKRKLFRYFKLVETKTLNVIEFIRTRGKPKVRYALINDGYPIEVVRQKEVQISKDNN